MMPIDFTINSMPNDIKFNIYATRLLREGLRGNAFVVSLDLSNSNSFDK